MTACTIVDKKSAFVNFRKQVLSIVGKENVSITYICDYDKILFTAKVKTKENTIYFSGNGKYINGKYNGRVFRISK